jgi:hypothetical protein
VDLDRTEARAFIGIFDGSATLMTEGWILSGRRADCLASSGKFHIEDKTEVRPSRAGFAGASALACETPETFNALTCSTWAKMVLTEVE